APCRWANVSWRGWIGRDGRAARPPVDERLPPPAPPPGAPGGCPMPPPGLACGEGSGFATEGATTWKATCTGDNGAMGTPIRCAVMVHCPGGLSTLAGTVATTNVFSSSLPHPATGPRIWL